MSGSYWEPKYEAMPRERLRELQTYRLKNTLVSVYENVPFYKKRLDDCGVNPYKFTNLDDVVMIPFTTKDDLRDNYPFGLFARPMNDIVRIHSSSGTTGNPTVVSYTKNDITMWGNLIARGLYSTGVRSSDIIQNSYGYGLFTGGLGLHYGAELLGATVIPVSGGLTERQLKIMQDYSSTVLCCTPSYALFIAEVGSEQGIDFKNLPLKIGIFGAEPWTEEMRLEIEARLFIDAIDIYGLSEIIGPGVSCECIEKKGLHIAEDHFYTEIIDPATGKNLSVGNQGEIVFTSLTKEAMPLLRYRSRDLSELNDSTCICGRTHARMKKPMGRTDDMLIIRGVNVFPSQIEEVLMKIKEIEPHYLIVVGRENYLDTIELWVEVSEDVFAERINDLEKFESAIESKLYSAVGISIDVKLKEPKTIKRSEGKAKRVVDKRKGEVI
ncbi:MAG: phenylacetate--CoA ligase [Actinobacteria bacterium]|nr:phenylacetate--CoA ligase [Actinomycetota bacterium]MBU4450427.1 phenylacetate--CoA ligase [Actinomycetota bacterium]MCG2789147.1 phenylacetate--CoA ligase [Actinomycetes bacterium]